MARARNLKPGFFTNGDLLDCQPLARLLFAGLWTEADCRGILEDRPKTLKIKLLPGDACDVDALLAELADHGFISRYQVGDFRCIAITNFGKHQNCHPKEASNSLPAPDEQLTSKLQASDEQVASPASSLHSSSNPSVSTSTSSDGATRAVRGKSLPDDFTLSDERLAYAVGRGHSTAEATDMFDHFQNHHRAKGSTMKDWDAAWRTWVGNQKHFGLRRAANGHAPPGPRTFFTKAEEDAERARSGLYREVTT